MEKGNYLLTWDVESKRRFVDPTAMIEISFVVMNCDTEQILETKTYVFKTDGPFTVGTLDFVMSDSKIENLFHDKIIQGEGVNNYEQACKMNRFLSGVLKKYPKIRKVLYPCAFDWMFLNTYLYHYVGNNVLGYNAEDLDSLARGHYGKAWDEKYEDEFTKDVKSRCHPSGLCKEHDSLYDAKVTAGIAVKVLKAIEETRLISFE